MVKDRMALESQALHANCRNIKTLLQQVPDAAVQVGVDGILLDLGISSMQVCHAYQWLALGPVQLMCGKITI